MIAIDKIVSENSELKTKLQKAYDEITELKQQLEWFKRQIFGVKSERFIPVDPLQCRMTFDAPTNTVPVAVATETVTYTRKRADANKTPHSREDIPAHLPRTIVEIEPDFDITGMKKIGEKITEELEYQPPKFTVTRYVRSIYKKTDGENPVIVCPEMPPRCIDKGKAAPSLVAHTIISKCVDHIPHYRLVQMINRECDMKISESTVHGWFEKGTFWLEAIVNRCEQIAFTSNYLQMDESTIQVMIQPTNGKSTQGAMILRHAVKERIILFDYRRHKNTNVLNSLITTFTGTLQTDGLEQYTSICENNPRLIHAGCMDHCRRGFEKTLTNDKNRASYALDEFKQLYAVEELAREQNLTDQQRLDLRKEKSEPVLKRLFNWMKQEIMQLKPKNPVAKAIGYALNREKELSRFLCDGAIELSNIRLENAVRPLAVGRKNYLFAGSENGAKRLAIAYSVLGTCKLNNINPSEYLPFVLKQLPLRSASAIDDLLPMNWKNPDKIKTH